MTAVTSPPVRRDKAKKPGIRWRVGKRTRKWWMVAHVATSVGWLGVDLALLGLGITGMASGQPVLVSAAYRAMQVLITWVSLPLAAGAIGTGVVLGWITKYGVFRYTWVVAKLALSVGAATAVLLLLRGTAGAAVRGDGSFNPLSLVMAPSVALCIYLGCTVLSYFKPWGRLRSR